MRQGDDFRETQPPLVSVILPVHNVATYVEPILSKVGGLQYSNIEVIVVDDASTDETVSLLAKLAPKEWAVVRLGENGGPGTARNAGMERAGGEYLWFPDWDDIWDPTIVNRLVAAAEETGSDLAIAGAVRVVDPNGIEEDIDRYTERRVLSQKAAVVSYLRGELRGYVWNKLFRKSRARRMLFPPMRIREDEIAIARFLGDLDQVVLIDETLYAYVSRVGSVTQVESSTTGQLQGLYAEATELVKRIEKDNKVERALQGYFYRTVVLPLAAQVAGPNRTECDVSVYRHLRSRMRFKDLLKVAVSEPLTAAKIGILKFTGPRFYQWLRVIRARRRVGKPDIGYIEDWASVSQLIAAGR